jgi:hypothetical protein
MQAWFKIPASLTYYPFKVQVEFFKTVRLLTVIRQNKQKKTDHLIIMYSFCLNL